MSYDPNTEDCPELFTTCLEPHPTLPGYVYTNNLGQDKFVPYPPEVDTDDQKVATNVRQEAGICYLDTFVDGVLCDSTDISTPILNKVPPNAAALEWVAATCTFQWTNPQGMTQFFPIYQDLIAKLPVGFSFDPATCVAKWTDVNGVCQSWNIGAAVAEKIRVEIDFDPDTCILTFLGPQNQFQNWNVGQAILAKVPRTSLTKITQPDGSQQLIWDNGYGQSSVCNLTPLVLDTDGGSITSDGVVTLNWGGDGNSGELIIDVCDIVGSNCNSYFTSITPYGWTYIDNRGVEQTWAFPALPTLVDKDGDLLSPESTYTILQPSDFASSGVEPPQDAQLLGFGPDGECVAYDVPPIPDQVTKDDIVEEFITIPAVPDGSELLFVDPDGECRRAPFPSVPPEVFIGSTTPNKDVGYLVWFDPATCIVKFCDNEGNWIEPRNVVCSPTAPACGKGLPDIWFNTAEGCLYICCEGVWVSSDTQAVRSVIDAMCLRVGDGPLQELPVVDGKVVIQIPEPPVLPRYCVQIGESNEIFGQETANNKLRFNLPEYPEFFETCLRIGGSAGDVIAPHFEDGKFYLDFDFPEFPEIPEIPEHTPSTLVNNNNGSFTHDNGVDEPVTVEFCPVCPDVVGSGDITVTPSVGEQGQTVFTVSYSETVTNLTVDAAAGTFTYTNEAGDPVTVDVCELVQGCLPTVSAGSSNVTVTPTPDPVTGAIDYVVSVGEQDIPPLPIFCVEDKAGNRINATVEEGKIVLALPPVLACQTTQPATDGSEGCIWYDDNCLHVLCDGTWVSPDASAIAG